VLLKLAARRILLVFAAAPPHLAAPLRPVRLARPVVILLLVVLLVAVLTDLAGRVVILFLAQFYDFQVRSLHILLES
jgi:hypothetical protein